MSESSTVVAERAEPGPIAPALPPRVPQRRSALGRAVGRLGLRLFGWKIEGNFPDIPKMVVIVAPHTSNWDFFGGFWAYLALDLAATWFGKHTLFKYWPLNAFLRHFGGVPIVRGSGSAANIVDQFVDLFEEREAMVVAIAPEGTRRKVREWKSGFYRIASRAGVPIVPVALDYGRSRAVIGAPFTTTGDWDADIPLIKALFAGARAKYPDQF